MRNLLIKEKRKREKKRYFGLKTSTWKSILFFISIIALVFIVAIDAKASVEPRLITPFIEEITPTPATDARILKVDLFLKKNNSPLAGYGEYIVGQADKYDIPWTLIVAISGKESSFGTAIKPNSYNAWGVMAWTPQGKRFIRSFKSWTEGIEFETKLLADNYRTNMNKGIQEKYCPTEECSSTWVTNVTQFQEDINQ